MTTCSGGLLALVVMALIGPAVFANGPQDPALSAGSAEPATISSQPAYGKALDDVNAGDVTAASADAEEPRRRLVSWNHFEGPAFSLRFGGVIMGDVAGYAQDAASVSQVGPLETATQLRNFRLTASGQIKFAEPWNYVVSGEYNRFDRGEDIHNSRTLQLTDMALTVPLPVVGRLTAGKFKEPISLGRLTGSANTEFMERPAIVTALLPSRGTGLMLSNTAFEERATWSVGWFNTAFGGDGAAANSAAARVTGVAIDRCDTLLHLGIAGRWSEAADNALHFRSRPEVNQAPYFVDTGSLAASSETNLDLEIAWQQGPVFSTAEYLTDWVSSSAKGSPFFDGFYICSAWMLTGEHRPYNARGGYFGAVSPAHPLFAGGCGALELAARYSWTDLNDAAIHGGRFARTSVALNWYATDNLRLEFNYGYGRLARSGADGATNFFQARLQFTF